MTHLPLPAQVVDYMWAHSRPPERQGWPWWCWPHDRASSSLPPAACSSGCVLPVGESEILLVPRMISEMYREQRKQWMVEKRENILCKICAWPFCLMAAKFWCSRPQKPTDWSSLIASGTVPALTGTHGGSNIGTQGIPRIGEGSVKLMLGGGIYETTSVLILFCYNDWKQSNIRVEYAHCR